MTITLDTKSLGVVLKQVAGDLQGCAAELQELDAQIGDGDLGVTAELAGKAMADFIDTTDSNELGLFLSRCGMAVNKASPSTFGTLLASGFLGAGKAIGKVQEIDEDDLVVMWSGAVEGIKNRGKAEVGDKTMLDSLVPGFEAFEKAMKAGGSVSESFSAAVEAAKAGMESTAGMKAKFGRASWRQEATTEFRDGGAVAMYRIIESFARHLREYTENS